MAVELKDVLDFLKANASNKEVMDSIGEALPEPNSEDIQGIVTSYLSETPEGKTYLQSITDKRVTDGIKTYKEKHFDNDYLEKYNKEHPPETPEQKEIRDLRIEQRKIITDIEKERQTTKALKILAEKGLPIDLLNLSSWDSDESVNANIDLITTKLKNYFEDGVKKSLKIADGDPTPKGDIIPKGGKDGIFTRDEVSKMSQKEVAQNLDSINKSMSTWE
jgi:hypothetical protein